MQIIPEKISTSGSPMPIINAKKAALWPRCITRFTLGLHNIQNNSNPIFIIIPCNSLIGISSISTNKAITLIRILSILIFRQAFILFSLWEEYLIPKLTEIQIATCEVSLFSIKNILQSCITIFVKLIDYIKLLSCFELFYLLKCNFFVFCFLLWILSGIWQLIFIIRLPIFINWTNHWIIQFLARWRRKSYVD